MSLETWKKEFYPVHASKVAAKDALAHSLKKWQGLQKKNLKKHGVSLDGTTLYDKADSAELFVTASSCALCTHYIDDDIGCPRCPLVAVRGMRCDRRLEREPQSPYGIAIHKGDTRPMLKLLKDATKLEAAADAEPC